MTESAGVLYPMPRSPTTIRINPQVFFWLIDKSGWKLSEIAHEIEYDEKEISKWKTEKENIVIPLTKIEIISRLIRRPLSAFFLPDPPADFKMPKDFRKLPENQNGEGALFAKETLLAIRKASHLQEVAQDLLKNLNITYAQKIPKCNHTNNPEEMGLAERKRTGISYEMQMKISSPTELYEVLRDWLEGQGVYVFQFNFPIEDARGFTLIEKDPQIIVISKSDAIRGKIFTLIHEYAHILLHESVVCNMDSDDSTNPNIAKIENWCNAFAASFLLPKDIATEEFSKYNPDHEDFLKFLETASKKYKISSISILTRFRFLNLIDYPVYISSKKRIKSVFSEAKKRKKEEIAEKKAKGLEISFPRNKPKEQSIWEDRGSNFVSLVLENSKKGLITERDVMDILELKVDHLVKLLPP